MDFDLFFEKLQLRYGFEYFGVFYGTYRGIVTRNDDPEGRGRVQCLVPKVGHLDRPLEVWINPSTYAAGDGHGVFFPPTVGSNVHIVFENGDPARPACYYGGFLKQGGLPSEFSYDSSTGAPERRGIMTRAGHSLLFDDTPGAERVRLSFHKPDPGDPSLTSNSTTSDRTQGEYSVLTMESDGTVIVANAKGSRFEMNYTNETLQIVDSLGNAVTFDSEGVKVNDTAGNFVALVEGKCTVSASAVVEVVAPTVNIKGGTVFLGDGADASALLGEQVKNYVDTHQHPSGTGLTGPPSRPLPSSALSRNVKIRS